MLAVFQRSLIYHPYPQKSLPAAVLGVTPGRAHDVATQSDDGLDLRGWLVLPKGQRAQTADELKIEIEKGRLLVLYFGGNAANRSYRQLEIETLCEVGADVLIFDYRGYGDSRGEPTEEGLARDAQTFWRYATETLKVDAQRIVLFGESLGGGVAVRLANELCEKKMPPAGLILRSTFSSLGDAGAFHFPWLPVRWLLIDRFPSEQHIRNVTCPLLQFHGRRDSIVPLRLGQQLFSAAAEKSASGLKKRFVELPAADHNDVIETSRAEVSASLREFFVALVAQQAAPQNTN